jgi:hypothetical protein
VRKEVIDFLVNNKFALIARRIQPNVFRISKIFLSVDKQNFNLIASLL